eukprot:m.217686 g.217686  ORF g.217686 m.217686 type:complete len:528 (-) comp13812_c0_seq16:241-1824(-)
MPTLLTFSPKVLSASLARVVVVGRQADLETFVRNGGLKFVSDVDHDNHVVPFATSCVSSLSPSEFNGDSSSVTVPRTEGDANGKDAESPSLFCRFCFVASPNAASRYNSVVRPDALARQLKSFMSSENGKGVEQFQVVYVLPENDAPTASQNAMTLAFSNGLSRALPTYTRKGNKQETSTKVAANVTFCTLDGAVFGDDALYANVGMVSTSIRQCAHFVDTPCNELHCTTFAQAARDLVKDLPVEVEEIVGEELVEKNLGGIYGVGKAAENPPRLLILKYTPEGAKDTVALCGKGIVYDTGGLSIKGKTFMPGMKRDMGGASGVLNAFIACVRMGFENNLYCLLAIAENSVGPKATRPDDIHVMYSGKTVEINNTDAEGRLVLADAVAYAVEKFSPSVLVNMCTLTGAQGVATGKLHAGIVCNDEAFEHAAVVAGRASGDLVHPLLYCPELFSQEFKSSVADMKNSVASPKNASVSCAAQFIGNHIPEEYLANNVWLHIDMAYPSFSGERATGYGVALLSQLLALKW